MLDPFVNDIFQYLDKLCSKGTPESIDLIKSIAGLMGDLAELYGIKLKPVLSLAFIAKTISILEKSTNKENRKLARWVKNLIKKIQMTPS